VNEGNRMSVFVYCPESSSVYEDRQSFKQMLQGAVGFGNAHVEVVSKKKQTKTHQYRIRIERDAQRVVEVNLPVTLRMNSREMSEQVITIMHMSRCLLPHNPEDSDAEIQMPLFSDAALEADDEVNPFRASMRDAAPILLFGKVLSRLLHQAQLTVAAAAHALYIDDAMMVDLIEGRVQDSLIDDDLLVDLSACVGVAPNILRILLARETVPAPFISHTDNDIPEQWLSEVWQGIDQDDL